MFQTIALGRIKSDPTQISKVKNPSNEFLIKAIGLNYQAIWYMDNPADDLVKIAVTKNIVALRGLPPQSEDVNLYAIHLDPRALKYIKDPSERVRSIALGKNGLMIGLIPNPTEAEQLMAVQNISEAITRIKSPSRSAELEAISDNYSLIHKMSSPHVETVLYAMQAMLTSKGRRSKLDLRHLNLTNDQWWEIVRAHPDYHHIMKLTPEQVSYAILCS